MCQIALSKKIKKVNFKNLVIYSSDSSEGSEINHATTLKFLFSHNKIFVTKKCLSQKNFSHKKILSNKKVLVPKNV